MEQLNRALKLHQLLNNSRHPITKSALLEQLECSNSTFKRLLSLLQDRYQAPISYDRRANGYYYATTNGQFQLPGNWLGEEHAFALLMAQRLLADVTSNQMDASLLQLQAQIQQQIGEEWSAQTDRLRIETIGRQYVPSDSFMPLVRALFQRQQLKCSYQPINGAAKPRRLSPQRLCWYRDNWYLIAWCHQSNALRTFLLSRIHAPEPLHEPALNIEADQLNSVFGEGYGIFNGNQMRRAQLRFDPAAAPWIKGVEWHKSQIQTLESSGHILLEFDYSDDRELLRDLLRFAAEVEVLAPQELREAFTQTLQESLKKHAGSLA